MGQRAQQPGIEALVRAAVRRHRAVRAAEGLLLGLAAALLTAAAALLSGAAPAERGPLAAAALAGLFCAGTWWLERRKTRAQLVRRVDRATHADGALVTAFECAGRPSPNALEAALVERAARAVDARAARRALAPPAAALLAAPLVAAALLTYLLETRPADGRRPAASQALQALSIELAGAVAPGSGAALDPELAGLLDRALELAARPGAAAALERALAELEAGLERRAAEAPGERAVELSRAASLARAARAEAGGPGTSAGRSPGERGAGAPGAETPGEDAGGPAAGPGLAAGPPGSTMEGSPAADGVTGGAGDPAREAGVVGVRTWEAQYDGVVSAWVLRAAAAGGERSSE